jgi:hypothetical protein
MAREHFVAPTLRARSIWAQVRRQPAVLLWCAFLVLIPLYILPVGLPQPADFIVFLFAPVALLTWNRRLDTGTAKTVRGLIWFTFWIALVNYAWAFILWKWTNRRDFVLHPLYYLFNLVLFVSAILVARRDRRLFLAATVRVAMFTVLVQVAASFVYRTQLYRGELFFDSPNQLGYYALLCACMFAITQRTLGIPRLWSAVSVSGCAYLALLSASRASLAGILLLLFVMVFSNPRTIVLSSIIALALISLGGPLSHAINAAEDRITHDRFRNLSFAEERGYDRLWNHPEYLVLGAGEGDYKRFVREGDSGRELHSSLGSIAFGYGIVGLTLFGVFLARVVRGASLRNSLMFVPALVYTVAHQGLRFTMFWVVLAVFVVVKQLSAQPREPSREARHDELSPSTS